MAGHAKKPAPDPVQDELQALRAEVERLRPIVAEVRPEIISQGIPKQIKEYSPSIIPRLLAEAAVGRSTLEIRARLGVTDGLWASWRAAHPEFEDAVQSARLTGRAYWVSAMSNATRDKDWKYPMDKALKMIETVFSEKDADDLGNASQLVRVNATTCDKCQPCEACRRLQAR